MDNNLKPVTIIPPFKRMCMTIGELPTSYLDSMTYYEMLLWLTKYLSETVIPIVNNNGLAVEELQVKYTELKNYVETYFDNLDVTEEVNKKLDEMAEDGTLENLITQYLELATTYVFNSVADMKNGSNFVNGSYARTSGFYSYNDGGGAYYKIRTVTNEDVIDNIHLFAITDDNTLVAELIKTDNINILQLGAIPNDNTKGSENATIIQYGLDNYSIVNIPKGEFYTNKLTLPKETTLKGVNSHTSILNYTGNGNENFIELATGLGASNYYMALQDLYLDGKMVNGVTGVYIPTSYVKINNCEIHNFKIDGIKIESCNNIEIEKCFIQQCRHSGINCQYSNVGHGQINAVYIHNNNIVHCNIGIIMYGNNIVITENTIQANDVCHISIGSSEWDETFSQFCLSSVISNNYTEGSGIDINEVNPVIKVYSGYLGSRSYNRVIRNLVITGNYFQETNNDNSNTIFDIITDSGSDPSSKATELIIHDNYSNTINPLHKNFMNALSYGSEFKNNSTRSEQNNIPYYVIQNTFLKNSPSGLHNDGYSHLTYQTNLSMAANTGNQFTVLIYPKNENPDYTLSGADNDTLRTIIKAYATATKNYGNAGKYMYRSERVGGSVANYEGIYQFKDDSPTYTPAISPISLIQNHSHFQEGIGYGYQISILPKYTQAFPVSLYLEIITLPSILKFFNVEIITETRKAGSGVPSSNADYVGQLYYNVSNSTWYVATDTTGTWRSVTTN